MDTERHVADHYTRTGIEQAILDALRALGRDIERLHPDDLAEADEFHFGWRASTVALARDLGLGPGTRVLDIGSGIGGPARYFAAAHGCTVTGIDLTAEFVAAAVGLTRRCGLADRVTFRQGSALAMDFEPGSFDVATLIHVGMNIADKARLFAEAKRMLRPGGAFAVYDLMRTDAAEIPYPMPWAATAETSFVETPATYRRLLEAAGFAVGPETNRREEALKIAAEKREQVARGGPPALGPQVLMGSATAERLGNVVATVQRGTIAPVQMLARAL